MSWLFKALLPLNLLAIGLQAREVSVSDSAGLLTAIQSAAAGDVITLSDGTYPLNQSPSCSAAGTRDQPIIVRAENLGDVLIQLDTVAGFQVVGPNWIFENLEIEGVCASHSACEHAFHIGGRGDHTIIRRVKMHEFNAAIKGNGEAVGSERLYPDDVLIEYSELYNSSPRSTANPVTPIDVVGGRRWIIRGNFIHDHAKAGGNNISYAAFLKGHSRDGLFERNLVVCELLHSGQIRLGLSFGGGGSSPEFICEGGDCSLEHVGGVMRNNIIANCPADVGIMLNKAHDVGVFNNTLYNTTGIDLRSEAAVAEIKNNILSGRIRERDGGKAVTATNLTQVSKADFASWFRDPYNFDFGLVDGTSFRNQGTFLPSVLVDFCTNARDDGFNDIGAVEYDGAGACDTTEVFVAPETASSELFFAQFADGQGLTSQILLFNLDLFREATAFLFPRGDQGQSLSVDWKGALVSGTTDPTTTAVIPPGGMSLFETDGTGDLQAGSVTVLATGTISGVIVFAGPDLGLAGVGSSVRLEAGFSAPVVSNSAAGIRTGLAVMNLGRDAVDCGFELVGSDGVSIASSDGGLVTGGQAVSPLDGDGQFAVFPEELGWDSPVDFDVFQGIVLVECNGNTAATAIQVRPGQYATLPVFPE